MCIVYVGVRTVAIGSRKSFVASRNIKQID